MKKYILFLGIAFFVLGINVNAQSPQHKGLLAMNAKTSTDKVNVNELKAMLFEALEKSDRWDLEKTQKSMYEIYIDPNKPIIQCNGKRIEFSWSYTSDSTTSPGYYYIEYYNFVRDYRITDASPLTFIKDKKVKK